MFILQQGELSVLIFFFFPLPVSCLVYQKARAVTPELSPQIAKVLADNHFPS